MPPRNRLPTPLSIHSYSSHTQPIVHSHLTSPPSPCSSIGVPRTPLTPPLRLHLRVPLPSSSLTPQTLASKPSTPLPWLWHCHLCGSFYRLGVTRRCLNDGHVFCSVPTPVSIISNEDYEYEDEDSGTGGGRDYIQQMVRNRRHRRARRQKRVRACAGEFDYSGWARYNEWRRRCRIAREMASDSDSDKGKGKGKVADEEDDFEWQEQKNCWEDCEFPSECNNTRLAEERLRLREALEEASGEEEEEEKGEDQWGLREKVMGIEDWEKELQAEKGREFQAEALELESENPDTCSTIAVAETRGGVEIGAAEKETQGFIGTVDIGFELGSNGVLDKLEDVFGVEFANKKMRKSFQKIARLTGLVMGNGTAEKASQPTSPLRVGFTFDEVVGSECSSEEGSVMDVDHVENRDEDMEELEKDGSMLRRKLRTGEQGEFGDEEEDGSIF